MLGVIRYDPSGKPICEICGLSFDRLLTHVRQNHNLSARDYKLKFGLDLSKGICSMESKQKSRKAVLLNFKVCVIDNLTVKGYATRFKKGTPNLFRHYSEQSKLRWKEELKRNKKILASTRGIKLDKTT